jgi:2-polyprenyl-3-methyl-5-hydroxy-6-metoxy-1,4-benzoquinol methylase
MSKSILSVSDEVWAQAQKDELHHWMTQGPDGDDWNAWWQEQFGDYSFIPEGCTSLLEVGCGPYAQNTRRIMALHPGITKITLLDPLMKEFIEKQTAATKIEGATLHSFAIEDKYLVPEYDVVVCINVLDHVQNIDMCLDSIASAVARGGMIIIGQDLSNEEDFRQCPESWADTKHPIKLSLEDLAPYLMLRFNTQFVNILPREKGRNPKAHYATLLWAGLSH